jgi:hypothetical protein
MFRAALTSRSWLTPHSEHTHCLTPSDLTPRGPLLAEQPEHVTVENLSETISTTVPWLMPLYDSMVFNAEWLASYNDFATLVLHNPFDPISPTITSFEVLHISVVVLWFQSLRLFFIFACSDLVNFFLPARCIMASFFSYLRVKLSLEYLTSSEQTS